MHRVFVQVDGLTGRYEIGRLPDGYTNVELAELLRSAADRIDTELGFDQIGRE